MRFSVGRGWDKLLYCTINRRRTVEGAANIPPEHETALLLQKRVNQHLSIAKYSTWDKSYRLAAARGKPSISCSSTELSAGAGYRYIHSPHRSDQITSDQIRSDQIRLKCILRCLQAFASCTRFPPRYRPTMTTTHSSTHTRPRTHPPTHPPIHAFGNEQLYFRVGCFA